MVPVFQNNSALLCFYVDVFKVLLQINALSQN